MIEIKNLSFRYAAHGGLSLLRKGLGHSSKNVFTDFSVTLKENRIYGLLGKNGTGKSTLLYLISGLLRPTAGTVTFDGVETKLRRPEMLREIFLVPEEFDMPPVTLEAYIRMNAPFYPRFRREVLDSCLSDFGMQNVSRLDRLSMGQKKKIFMSFALAAGTRLLLMDEPTNGLDIPSKAQFRRVVTGNMSDDSIVVISTHQVHDVEQLLDHVLIASPEGMLLDSAVADLCDRYTFEYRMPGSPSDDVIYAEPTLQGNAVMARRAEGAAETQLNLELLFNAVTQGKLK
ncbi:MAG: ATP-binding cassette domain-containing protein [Prevotella sp.]|nr:ATP-binding cassette domain-containing protein [Prevotella sp.]